MKETISREGFAEIEREMNKLDEYAGMTKQPESLKSIANEKAEWENLKNSLIEEVHEEALIINEIYDLEGTYPFDNKETGSIDEYILNLHKNAIASFKETKNAGAGYDKVIDEMTSDALAIQEKDEISEEDRKRFIEIIKNLKKGIKAMEDKDDYGIIEWKKFFIDSPVIENSFRYIPSSINGPSRFCFKAKYDVSPADKRIVEVDIKHDIRGALDISRLTEKRRMMIMECAPQMVRVRKYDWQYYVDDDDILRWSYRIKKRFPGVFDKQEIDNKEKPNSSDKSKDDERTKLLDLIKWHGIPLEDLEGNIYNLGDKKQKERNGKGSGADEEGELVYDPERVKFLISLKPEKAYNIKSFFRSSVEDEKQQDNKSYLAFELQKADGRKIVVISTDLVDNADFVFDAEMENEKCEKVWQETAKFKKDEIRIKKMPAYIGRQIHIGDWRKDFVERFMD